MNKETLTVVRFPVVHSKAKNEKKKNINFRFQPLMQTAQLPQMAYFFL